MKLEDLLSLSEELATCLFLSQKNPLHAFPPYFFKPYVLSFSLPRLGLESCLFPLGFFTVALHTFMFSSKCPSYPLDPDTRHPLHDAARSTPKLECLYIIRCELTSSLCRIMYACMYVCMFVCMCVCVCMYVCMQACMHACMYVCMHACMYVCMYICMYLLCM
jgi:hypothetical protein